MSYVYIVKVKMNLCLFFLVILKAIKIYYSKILLLLLL